MSKYRSTSLTYDTLLAYLCTMIIGYIFAILIGTTLGLIGGGGSILAVPVLAYLFTLDEKTATAYSLFIVGTGALVGGLKQHRMGNVDWKTALFFGLPALIGVWFVRHNVVPSIPEHICYVGAEPFTRRMLMFGTFAILMIIAAYMMLKGRGKGGTGIVRYNYPLILVEGFVVGGITGFVGAGGGFLIIPALVFLANLEMKQAIGTSLIIIAIKSVLGFLSSDALTMSIDWEFLLLFTGLVVVGIFAGTYLGNFLDGKRLKKGFGYFIISMAVFIFVMEFYIKNQ